MRLNRQNDLTTIIISHWGSNEMRSYFLRKSLYSLWETTKHIPCEIIVVDNGGNDEDTKSLIQYNMDGRINTYIRNSDNMHFGFARNQALSMALGNYIVIADNDILYKKGWIESCLSVLKNNPMSKIYSTPVDYPTGGLREKYWQGEIGEYRLSMRAGSNCFMVRRKDFEVIGKFLFHRIAGTVWTDKAVRLGYLAAVAPGFLAEDLGLRKGYNHRKSIPIIRTLTNGEELVLNEDEYEC